MSSPGYSAVGGRKEARERAVELAYEADARSCSVDELLATMKLPPEPYAALLLRASELERDRTRSLIAAKATGWSLERMPTIDRLVMEMAVAEMLTTDTPTGVVLAEAVDLVSRYSTEESGRFVNGVLAAIARDVRHQ